MESSKPWHESLPAVYRDELDTLQHGLPNFIFNQQRPFSPADDRLIVDGEIKFGEGLTHLVQIIFPHAYPHTPPEFFPLEQIQINAQFRGIKIKHFGRGNQYINGKICLFKDEDEWIPFTHGVGMAMNQAQRWLETAHSEEGFTKALVVQESIPIIQHQGQVLCYLQEELPTALGGNFLLKSFKEHYYSLLQIQFDTEKGKALIESFPDNTVLSPSTTEIVFGKWVTINEASAKQILPQLIDATNQIDPNRFNAMVQQFFKQPLNILLPSAETAAKKIILGLRFSNEGDFHLFEVNYWTQGIQTHFKANYLLLKNLEKELFARIDALFNLNVLADKKVLVIGQGAIGSEAAEELAVSGIGHYTLVDDEKFEAGNSVRHAADLLQVGEFKVEICKKLIEARNPKAKVEALPISVLHLPPNLLEGLIDSVDVVLDLTANRLVENYLNQKVCIEKGKPMIQAAVSKGGLTGIILALVPGKSACLECLKEKHLNHVPTSLLDAELLQNTAPEFGACSQPALPASGMDTREVALQTARLTLQLLLTIEKVFYPKLTGYQYYWHGPAGTKDHPPFEWEIQNSEPTANCIHCKN